MSDPEAGLRHPVPTMPRCICRSSRNSDPGAWSLVVVCNVK